MNELLVHAATPASPAAPLMIERRIELLKAVERSVDRMARDLRAPAEVTLAVFARITHALLHRINRLGEVGLEVDRLLSRLEDIAHRRLVREWKKRLMLGQAGRAPVLDDEETRRVLGDPFARRPRLRLNRVLQAHEALSPVESQVLRLEGMGCSTELVAAVLGLTVNAVEFHRSQARGMIMQIYREDR